MDNNELIPLPLEVDQMFFNKKFNNEEDEKIDILNRIRVIEKRKGINLSKLYNTESSLIALKSAYIVVLNTC